MLWDTKIESEYTKKLSNVWCMYFFEYIPIYFEELEKRLDIHEEALEDILIRKEELRDAEIKALQDGQKEIIERLDSVVASVNVGIATLNKNQTRNIEDIEKLSKNIETLNSIIPTSMRK